MIKSVLSNYKSINISHDIHLQKYYGDLICTGDTDLLKPNENDLLFATALSFINRIGIGTHRFHYE